MKGSKNSSVDKKNQYIQNRYRRWWEQWSGDKPGNLKYEDGCVYLETTLYVFEGDIAHDLLHNDIEVKTSLIYGRLRDSHN